MALVALAWGEPVHAATVSGTGLDARDAVGSRPDLERLTVSYDDSRGLVEATYRMYEGPFNDFEHMVLLRFGLSKPGQGGCATPATEPDLDFRAVLVFADEPTGFRSAATFNPRTGFSATIPARYSFASLDFPFTMEDPRLVGMGFRCVTRVFADNDSIVEDGDQITKFCLAANDCFAAVPTPIPTPSPTPTPTPQPAGASPPLPAAAEVQVLGEGPISQTPATTPAKRVLSRAQAYRQTMRALRQVKGKLFTSGRRYRAACSRNSTKKWTCAVSWRNKRYRYGGNVVVRLGSSGYQTTVNVQRRPS